MDIKLTKEQIGIVSALKSIDNLKINAYAGTGKTSTLIALAENYPNKKFLVLTFNRSIAQELKRKVPSNCYVYTVHALAYKFLPGDKKEIADRKVFMDKLIDMLDLHGNIIRAYFYREVYEAFCNSLYIKPSVENVKKLIMSNISLKQKFYYTFSNEYGKDKKAFFKKEEIIEKVADALEYIIYSVDKGYIPITHDYYLKYFQTIFNSQAVSEFFKKFDVILVDEGQDLNGIQEYILRHAPVPQKVIVGDRHQSIYSWRGAVNTLSKLDWREYSLTCLLYKSEAADEEEKVDFRGRRVI